MADKTILEEHCCPSGIWDAQTIKQFEHEIQWIEGKLLNDVSKRQQREYEHQIRKKELEIAFNGTRRC